MKRFLLYMAAAILAGLAIEDIHRSISMHLENDRIAAKNYAYSAGLQETIDLLKWDLKALADDKKRLTEENDKLRAALAELQGSTPGMYGEHLRGVIRAALSYIGAKHIPQWERLLCLTIAAESQMGRYTRQLKGPARGITQVEPDTERTALRWLSKNEPDMFARLKQLRVPAKLDIHEAEYNAAYSIALAYAVYRWRQVEPTAEMTVDDLAAVYKAKYNTAKGKANVDAVLTRLTAYGIDL